MTPLVVDASIACKWFLPEADADRAQRLLSGRYHLLAPDLLWTEVASVVWKSARRRLISPDDARRIVRDAITFPVETHPCEPLLPAALDLALHHDRTVYDALYLALAARESATFVTEDARLVRGLGSRGPVRAVLLADCA